MTNTSSQSKVGESEGIVADEAFFFFINPFSAKSIFGEKKKFFYRNFIAT